MTTNISCSGAKEEMQRWFVCNFAAQRCSSMRFGRHAQPGKRVHFAQPKRLGKLTEPRWMGAGSSARSKWRRPGGVLSGIARSREPRTEARRRPYHCLEVESTAYGDFGWILTECVPVRICCTLALVGPSNKQIAGPDDDLQPPKP